MRRGLPFLDVIAHGTQAHVCRYFISKNQSRMLIIILLAFTSVLAAPISIGTMFTTLIASSQSPMAFTDLTSSMFSPISKETTPRQCSISSSKDSREICISKAIGMRGGFLKRKTPSRLQVQRLTSSDCFNYINSMQMDTVVPFCLVVMAPYLQSITRRESDFEPIVFVGGLSKVVVLHFLTVLATVPIGLTMLDSFQISAAKTEANIVLDIAKLQSLEVFGDVAGMLSTASVLEIDTCDCSDGF